MKKYQYTSWSIEGHTDNTGSAEKNLQLSKDRAASVKQYFVRQGIDAGRLTSEGYGDTKPIGDNKTSKGRTQNRRVEIKLNE
jgi:outer membrane protein OmpA-like peptidoglycan-associated protein